jgi:hypothetical protein
MALLCRGLIILAAVAAALVGATPQALAEKRVALVIGNSAYRHISRLDNPVNDARLMAGTLRDLGFVLVGGGAQIDLDKAAFDAAVQNFGRQLAGAEVGLFYYAGHGVQVRGANYLVPVTANPARESDVDFQMLDTNVVLRQMEGAGTRLNLVILDACRNNPFGGRGLRTTASGLGTMQAPEGTLISFATQPGNVALDGTGTNSPYTVALAQAIRRPGLDIFQTFNEVGLAVKRTTGGQQQPWVSLSPIAGNFYFAGAPASAATVPSPTPAWAAVRDTQSVAILEEFVRQYGASIYGSLARARIDELKRTAAVVPPAPAPAPQSREPSQQWSGDRYGAIALSPTRLAWGEGHDYATQALAEERAMEECKKRASDCQKIRWVRNACHALATGRGVWGHAWNDNIDLARSEALGHCRNRGSNCSVVYAGCSKP